MKILKENRKTQIPGIKLNLDFAGYPITLHKIQDEYYAKCKGVFIASKDYEAWEKDPINNILGYTAQGRSCQISVFHGFVTIGCISDTENKFKKIVNIIKKQIKNDTNSRSNN